MDPIALDHANASLARARELMQAAMRDPQRCAAHLAQAASLLMAAAASAPDDGALLSCLGAVLCDQGRHREAVGVLQRAARLRTDDRNTCFNLGVALLNSGKRRQAMQRFRQAAALRVGRDLGGLLRSPGALIVLRAPAPLRGDLAPMRSGAGAACVLSHCCIGAMARTLRR